MKAKITLRKLAAIPTMVALLFSTYLYAQPTNDNCVNALAVTIGIDEASCVPVEGSTVDGTPSAIPSNVCSGSWFGDDIWFSFTSGSTVPDDGYTIKALFGTEPGDIIQVGMALYESCDADAIPLVCFSDSPGRNTIEPYGCDLLPDHTYYVRIWSAPGVNDNSGTLRLCVFNAPPPPPPPIDNDNILWGDNPGEGDFDGGLNGWAISNDTLHCGADFDLWRWAPIAASIGNSCGNSTSSSPTYCNGGMVFNSDAYDSGGGPCGGGGGPCSAPQTGELISPPIDLSGFDIAGVSVKFYQTTRQYNSTYFVSYSNDDGVTWIDREINEELIVNSAIINDYKQVFLKDADLNATNFRIKFRYVANFYYWIIDDVRLIETPANDLQTAPNNWYAVAPNAVTPVSQVEPFSHLADIYNGGAVEQTNVNLNVTIVDNNTSDVVFTDNLQYLPIPGDSTVQNLPMPGYFTPDGSIPTSYTATYEITSDSVDANPTNNVQSYTFMTSDTVFAKEFGGNNNYNPAATNWETDEAHSAAYGNFFYIVDGDNWDASSVTFAVGNVSNPELAGRLLKISLYKWIADTNDNASIDPGEREEVGVAYYSIEGTEAPDDLITVPLFYPPGVDPGPIDIESNQAYAVMVEYSTNDQVDFLMRNSTNLDFDYGAMIHRSRLDGTSLATARYSGLTATNDPISDAAFGTLGFGWHVVPVVRLNIAAVVDTKEQLDAVNDIRISPNPANSRINISFDLIERQRVTLRILDINGRLITEQSYNDVQNEVKEIDISNFATGAYFLDFITENGVRIEKFIVQR